MPSLPQPGEINWGSKLNEFILTGHNTDGTLKGVMSGVLNVKDFGAKGDGITDDSAAFQAMVDSIPVNGGAIVIIPPGLFKIATPVAVTDRAINWCGTGGTSICEVRCNTGFLSTDISGMSSIYQPYFGVRDLAITTIEASTPSSVPVGTAILFKGANTTADVDNGCNIENVSIRGANNFSTQGFRIGISLDNVRRAVLHNVRIIGSAGTTFPDDGTYRNMQYGVLVKDNCTGPSFDYVRVTSAETCLAIVGPTITEGGSARRCIGLIADYGITGANYLSGWQDILHCHFSTHKYGIKLANSHAYVMNNLLFRAPNALASQDYIGIEIDGRGCHISHNSILNQSPNVPTVQTMVRVKGTTFGDYSFITDNNLLSGFAGNWIKTIDLESGTKENTVAGNISYVGAPVIVNAGTNNQIVEWRNKAVPTIASSASLALPVGHDLVKVSGTADITSIMPTYIGNVVTLIFTGTAATNGVVKGSNLKLANNFLYTPNSVLKLVFDGTNWYEVSRSPN